MTLSCRILISFSVHDLEILFKKRLLVNFESDESEQEREIELKTNEITSIFKHAVYMTSTCYTKKKGFSYMKIMIISCRRQIMTIFISQERKLNEFAAEGRRDSSIKAADLTVRKNLQMSMARKLQGLSTTFRQKQRVGAK